MYDSLNRLYDRFNNGFEHSKYLELVFAEWALPKNGLVLDCGCGTGELMENLFKYGYDCTGVDSSDEMLDIAREKLENSGYAVHLVCQDLSEIDLYGAYDIVFCTLDTVNHITDKRLLKKFFARLYNFIEPNGYFIFDIKTKSGFEKASGQHVYDQDGDVMIMSCDFGGVHAFYDFTLFEKSDDGRYNMSTDFVEERCYDPKDIKTMLSASGLKFIGRKKYGDRLIYCYSKVFC
ncbi:MAG: hypothetical protein DBX47_06610 [Clostridiales bacterium]|nr:MAG: hypothetical protein DBX47_06610 [Clostridiales bacterium]